MPASVAAARAIAGDDPRAREASRALDVRAIDGSVTIHQHRSGERKTYSVTVHGLPHESGATANGSAAGWSPSLISAQLSDPPVDVSLTEMTERQRAVVEDAIRQRLVAVAFGDEAPRPRLAATPRSCSRTRSSTWSTSSATSRARNLTRLHALLDLLEIERLHVPFDAQTRFYETFLADGRPWPDEDLAGLATRLGFAKPEQA